LREFGDCLSICQKIGLRKAVDMKHDLASMSEDSMNLRDDALAQMDTYWKDLRCIVGTLESVFLGVQQDTRMNITFALVGFGQER
jgi:hypothetical protein